ncbi:hypothetical protein QQP08_027337 [Theobroma cacao]|nr:hypothetical protein QQP08_027337 [Theobroma cacao]
MVPGPFQDSVSKGFSACTFVYHDMQVWQQRTKSPDASQAEKPLCLTSAGAASSKLLAIKRYEHVDYRQILSSFLSDNFFLHGKIRFIYA